MADPTMVHDSMRGEDSGTGVGVVFNRRAGEWSLGRLVPSNASSRASGMVSKALVAFV